MEAKIGEIEKKSYTFIKNRLNHSAECISSISSKIIDKDYWRTVWKKESEKPILSNKKLAVSSSFFTKKDSSLVKDEFRLSVHDFSLTNNCFKLDEFDTSNSKIPIDSYA